MAKAKEPKPPKPPTKKLRKEFFKAFGDVDEVTKVLDGGVDPNTLFDLDRERPALAYALERNQAPKVARLLLDRGIDVTLGGARGVTALHTVEDPAIAAELIERGADVNARDHANRTPLHTAAEGKEQAVAEILIARGAELEAVDGNGRTPYASASHVGIRRALREAGARPFGPGGGNALAFTTVPTSRSAVNTDRGAVGVDGEGNTWFWGYGGGLVRTDGTTYTKYVFEESLAIAHIAAGPPGVVYFGTSAGLLRLRGDELRLYSSLDSELFDNHITFLTTGPDGRAYMLHYESEAEDKHISVFDGEVFTVLAAPTDFPPGLELERIRFDRRGELMLAGRGGFAVKRDGVWDARSNIDAESKFSKVVYDVLDDGEALWLGTQTGVYELRGEQVTKHEVKNLAKYLLQDGDTIWVGTYYGGLARIRAGEVTIFDEKNSPLPHDDVQGLVRGTNGTIWVQLEHGIALITNGELGGF